MHCQKWLDSTTAPVPWLIFHVPNERKGGVGTGVHFKRLGVKPGVADYLLFVQGRAAAIELKDEKGEQSEAQKKFQRVWEMCGNSYFLVRSLPEFQGVVDALTLFA